ncbi:MAG: glutathione transferase, partial [Deltaproteobacteria bacterium]|nr:glutathione transferase [Kofleriaceae bacterium]
MSTPLVLYGESTWVSPWVFHVMAALEEKQLPYTLELLPLPIPPEQKRMLAEHAIIGKVPVLRHGELWLTESLAISEYLAETFPYPGHPRLFPADLTERARARQVMSYLRTDTMALRDARPTSSVFGPPVSGPLENKAKVQADELVRLVSTFVKPGRTTMFTTWSIADADAALALMRLIKNGDPVPDHIRAYAEAQWARPSLRAPVVLERLLDLLLAVHDERAVLHDGLADRAALEEQELGAARTGG